MIEYDNTEYLFKLEQLKSNVIHIQSAMTGNQICSKCSLCCWVRPCSLEPNDLKNISEYLKITEEELFKNYLCVDTYMNSYVILPIRHQQHDFSGKFLDSIRSWDIETPCVFLENGKCKIHIVKPFGGKNYKCWENKQKSYAFFWKKETIEKRFNIKL